MQGNYTPWIILSGLVLVSLYYKGYLVTPSLPSVGHLIGTQTIAGSSLAPKIDELVKLGSYPLGIAFARATKLEAEDEAMNALARVASDAIRTAVMAPFSQPAPAGPAPSAGSPASP